MGTRGTVRKNRGKRGKAKTKTLALKGGYRYGKKSKTMGKGLRLSIRRKKIRSRSRSRSRSRNMRGGNMGSLTPADFETSTNNVLSGFPYPEGGQSINTSGGYGFDGETGEYLPVSQCGGE